jgi:MFS family permease
VNKLEKNFIAKISVIMAIRMLGLFMIFPVFAILGADYLYANEFLIGVAIGAYGLTQGFLQIPFGYLSDKFGRKPLIIFGLITFTIGSLIAAISENIYLVILGRLIAGSGAIASVLMAFVADVVSVNNRSKANAMIGMQIGIAFMLALIIGPIMANYFGLSGIFYLAAILAILSLFIIPTLPQVKTSNYSFSLSSIKTILTAKLLSFDLSIFLLHFILTSIFVIVPRFLTENITFSYLIVLGVSFIIMLPFIIIAEKKKQHKNILLFALLLLLISQIILFNSQDYYILITLLIIFFIGFNLVESLMPSIIAKNADAYHLGKRGLIMGVYSSAQFFGAFSGGLITGYLMHNLNMEIIIIYNIILIILWMIMIFRRQIWQE